MKVLMANWWPAEEGAGGVQAHVYWLASALERRGHAVDVMHLADIVRPAQRQRFRWPINAPHLADTAQTYLTRAREAKGLSTFTTRVGTHASGFDLIHFHDFTRIVPMSRRLQTQGIPMVWTNHLGEFLKLVALPGGAHVTRWATKQFAAAIAPSEELANRRAIAAPTTYIPNGVELARFPPSREGQKRELRLHLGVDPDRPLVVVPRRWSPTKGVLEAAMSLDHLRGVDLTIAFLGEEGSREYPSYGAKIRAQLTGRPNVIVHDKVSYEAMSQWLRASSATLIPSVLEATSLSALEAMAAGSVVIATPVGGLVQLVRHDVNGILLQDRQPLTIATAVQSLLRRSAAETDALRASARALVEDEYSWDAVAARTEQVYERAVGMGGTVS
jgi:glycosyltransferase involved in cell wall biosynthesis